MTKPKSIAQLLGFTEEQYYNEYVSRYMRWCLQFGITNEHLQQIMANRAICNYYNEQHADLENQAYEILAPQDAKITIAMARRIYSDVMTDIFKAFPKPLIEAARRLSITNNLN